MTSPTVQLRNVSKSFKGTTALDGVTLDLQQGVVGLLGPNGAGKTTLLRILATVLGADAGSVRILGHDPTQGAQRTEIRRRLGYLPQELGYPRGFTAYGFVDYMAVLKEWDEPGPRRQQVRTSLDKVGLTDLSTKRIRALSGGQRRRVGLAQALLGEPQFLVLDEPTTGLDPEQRVLLRQVLAEAGRTATVLVATHQTEDVAALCERVVVLDGGTVRFDGAVRDLVGLAQDKVWLADTQDPRARLSWRTVTGRYRNLGDAAPTNAEIVEATVEDAYLLLCGSAASRSEVSAS